MIQLTPSSDTGTVQHPPIIELDAVSKVFASDEVKTHALAGVHLKIAAGEFIAISGPSGSGKSTLLAILGLLDSPTHGHYRFEGRQVENFSPRGQTKLRNQQIGFIFQSFNLIGELDVFENVALPLRYRGVAKAELTDRVTRALQSVDMGHRLRHRPAQLSGGQQQRVAVARAIVTQPSILLADEPTGNLDSENGEAVMDLLRGLHREGTTICMVTHDPRYTRAAQRCIRLFDGRIVDDAQAMN